VNTALPRWRAFPPLALGAVMATLDISVVNIALPTLSRAFGVPLTRIEWVVLAYVVTLTGLMLVAGRLADRVGRRRLYGAGLIGFAGASALCGAAPSAAALIAARVLQGVGAAMMSANSAPLLVSNFPEAERGRALGAFGAAIGVGLAIGTPLGGLVIHHASWRWLFLVNLPIAALAGLLLVQRVPRDTPAAVASGLRLGPAALWCGALVSVMLALSRGPELGFGRADVWALFPLAAILLALLARLERDAPDPLLPPRFIQGPLGVAVSLTLLSQVLSIAVGFHLPFYLEEVLRFDAGASGRWLSVMPLAVLLAAPLAGRLSDRLGTRPVAASGMALTVAGFLALSLLGTTLRPVPLLGGLALIGIGQGLFAVPNASALLSLVPPELLGFASGLQGTMRNLGLAAGAAAMAALIASLYAGLTGTRLPAAGSPGMDAAALARATRTAFLALAALSGLATLITLRARVHGAGRAVALTPGPAGPGRP